MSKKVGNAVHRNRVKRVVREFVRTARPDNARWNRDSWLPEHADVVVIAKPSARVATTSDLWDDLKGHACHLRSSSGADASGGARIDA